MTRRATGRVPWWGEGESPTDLWPGVTIDIPTVWSSRRDRWESPGGEFYFDAAHADRACLFFPTFLVHHIGAFAGEPFVLLDYQAKLLTRPFFGWKKTADGLRRFRKLFAFIPKGGGKSPWGAGTGIYLARCDNEPAAEVYCVAADTDQARIVHENAKIMVEASADLLENCEVRRNSIFWTDTKSIYRVMSSDAKTKHGFRPHGVIFDEIHAQRNRDLYEALHRSMVKRRQPAMIMLTHAGDDDEGIGFEEYEYAKSVLGGTVPDPACLPVIFEMSPSDDWTDPAIWRKVNPGHGITVQHEGIAAECLEAQYEPRKLNDFLMFHGNRWTNQATAWIPVDWWDRCTDPMPSDEVLNDCLCAFGIDMAQKIDLAAGVAVFLLPLADVDGAPTLEIPAEVDGTLTTRRVSLAYRIAIVPQFWMPEETLRQRVKQDHLPYDRWADQGLIVPVEGAILSSEPIVRYMVGRPGRPGLIDRFPLLKEAEIGYDPAFATEIAIRLRDDHHLNMVEVPQGYAHLSEACLVFEALVKAGRVIHGGHRLLRNNLENCAIKTDDAGRIRPVKPRRQTKRIDGIVAVLIALSRLIAYSDAESDASNDYALGLPGARPEAHI